MAKTETQYTEAIGRRKTASARVRIVPASVTSVVVNEKSLSDYFRSTALEHTVLDIFSAEIGDAKTFAVSVHVVGGGLAAQAGAIRLGIARALVADVKERRGVLKKAGYLKRDPRSKERKKFGLRKARKSPQWSKR